MELKIEVVGAVIGVVAIFLGAVKWVISCYAEYRVKENSEELDIRGLRERIDSLELDVKEIVLSNTQLSNNFHAEINKILHKLPGGSNE